MEKRWRATRAGSLSPSPHHSHVSRSRSRSMSRSPPYGRSYRSGYGREDRAHEGRSSCRVTHRDSPSYHRSRSRSRSYDRSRRYGYRSRSRSRTRSRSRAHRYRSRSRSYDWYGKRVARSRSRSWSPEYDSRFSGSRSRSQSPSWRHRTHKRASSIASPDGRKDIGDLVSKFVDGIAEKQGKEGDGSEEEDKQLAEMEEVLMKKLGIPVNFDSTKGKHVPDANVYAVKRVSKRQPRQYMNRRCGFNKPLPPEVMGR